MLIFRNFLPARSDNWPRKWRVQRPLPNTLGDLGDLPAAQIHHMCHQHTEFAARNYNKHKKATKQKAQNHRATEQMPKKHFDLQKPEKPSDRCIRCGNTPHTKGFQCPAKKFQCKICHKFSHFTSVCYQKNQQTSGLFIPRKPKAHQL